MLKDVTDVLFKFPFLIVDIEEEEEKDKLGSLIGGKESEINTYLAEAEMPYYDFASVMDTWGPTEESREMGKNGKFDHCKVSFYSQGSLLVPWNKQKFKAKLKEFIASLPKDPVKKPKNVQSITPEGA